MIVGEKFIEKKIEGNKIIRISEWKEFNHDFESLIHDINDYISDDWETQMDKGGIYCDRLEDFDVFDADMVKEWLEMHIEEEMKENDDDIENYEMWTKWFAPLSEAKGFTIHLKANRDLYFAHKKGE